MKDIIERILAFLLGLIIYTLFLPLVYIALIIKLIFLCFIDEDED